MNKILFGSDPEGFYARIGQDGKIYVVPPAKYRLDMGFPTTGTDPRHPVFAEADGQNGKVKLIEDGCAFELTTAPSENIETLFQDIQLGYSLADEVADKFGNFVSIVPTINYDVPEFIDREDEFAECLIFGCDPDRDVFENEGLVSVECMEESALEHPYRYGGGHIHISGVQNFQVKPLLTVKMCAFTVGNLVTAQSPMKELDYLRTYRYGRPGRFRIQEYGKLFKGMDWTNIGIEYRTPSNAWTTDLPLAKKIAEAFQMVAECLLPNDGLMEVLVEDIQDRTIQAVMKGDPALAQSNYDAVLSMI